MVWFGLVSNRLVWFGLVWNFSGNLQTKPNQTNHPPENPKPNQTNPTARQKKPNQTKPIQPPARKTKPNQTNPRRFGLVCKPVRKSECGLGGGRWDLAGSHLPHNAMHYLTISHLPHKCALQSWPFGGAFGSHMAETLSDANAHTDMHHPVERYCLRCSSASIT